MQRKYLVENVKIKSFKQCFQNSTINLDKWNFTARGILLLCNYFVERPFGARLFFLYTYALQKINLDKYSKLPPYIFSDQITGILAKG